MPNDWSPNFDCAEESGTCTEAYEDFRGIMRASVTLRCKWSERHSLVADICGNRRAWPKGAAGLIPKAMTASIVPVPTTEDPSGVTVGGEFNHTIVYGEALVTVNYSTEIVDVVSESIEPFAEFITLDHRFFRWGAGDGFWLREEEAPGKLVRGINFVRNELDVKPPFSNDLLDLVGFTNEQPITAQILGRVFDTETLLYAPPVLTYKKDSTGLVKFDITKKFTFNQNGWNKYFRPFTGQYEEIYLAGANDPYKNYPVGNLTPLTLPPPGA